MEYSQCEFKHEFRLRILQIGREPQKPYSGKIMLRIPPEIHARAAMRAEAHGKSLNSWVAQILSEAS